MVGRSVKMPPGRHVQTTPPTPPATPAIAPLRRAQSDRILLGVCGGLARTLGISAVWPRLAAVALAFTVPLLALVAYALAAVVVRRDDGRMTLGGSPPDQRETVIGWGLTLLAALIVVGGGGLVLPLPTNTLMLMGLAAAAGAAYVTHRNRTAGDGPPPPVDPPAAPPASAEVPQATTIPFPLSRPPADAPTATMPPVSYSAPTGTAGTGHGETAPAPTTPTPAGPSLLLVGSVVFIAWTLASVLLVPTFLGLTAAPTAVLGGATLGLMAAAGVVTSIALWDHRHAAGMLALSLAVGVMVLGLASVADQTGGLGDASSLLSWIATRIGDILRLPA